MLEETLTYYVRETPCKGFLVYDNTIEEQRPGIIIAHAWRGLDDFAKLKARELARLGYVAFAADLYGNGTRARTDEEASSLMQPLFVDRKLLQERVQGAFRTISQYPACDGNIGGIGFCFGGLAIIELLRSGAPVKGVVSFHGVLGNMLNGLVARTVPIAPKVLGSILILHGHDDPLVSQEDISSLQKELAAANVDWQMDIYGHTSHAFTNPHANDLAHGLVYNQKAALRSWKSMQTFFKEVFFEK